MRTISHLRYWILGSVLLLLTYSAKSQSNRVIYILADREQPFYVRTTDKVYSSSYLGYTIMPMLQQGKISLTIGFPKNKWSPIRYNIELGENDLFLLLKQIDSTTWGLYDKHSKQVFVPEEVVKQMKTDTSKDPFSVMLAEVSDNPSILQSKKRDVQDKEEKKLEGNPALAITEAKIESANKQQQSKENEGASSRQTNLRRKKKQKIERTLYLVDSTGLSMGYEVEEDSVKENIVLFIQAESLYEAAEKKSTVGKKKRNKQTEDTKVNPEEIVVSTDKKVDGEKEELAEKKICSILATESEFKSFRRNLAIEEDEEKMIVVSDTILANSPKCYSAEQIKNLAVLFLNDRLRVQFIETAIKHISDPQNLKLLDSIVPDEENRKKIRSVLEKKQQ